MSWKEVCEALGSESDEQTIGAYKSVWQRFKSKWAHDVPAGIDELETELQGKKERRDRGGALLREMDVTHEELSPVAPEPVRLRTSPPAAQPKQKAAMKYFRINVYGAGSGVRGGAGEGVVRGGLPPARKRPLSLPYLLPLRRRAQGPRRTQGRQRQGRGRFIREEEGH